MSYVKISELPAATSAAGTDQLETNQSGTSRRLTVAQVATYVSGNLASPTITGSTVVSANTSTDAVRITQTGTGNALVVEDSANPDATPFVVSANGNVGIGTTAPSQNLDVASAGNAAIRLASQSGRVDLILSAATDTVINNTSNTPLIFATNNAERMRITAAGNVGIGTSSPAVRLAINSTDAVLVPVGTTGQRPTGATGYLRYNSSLNSFEGHNGTAWGSIGGGATGGGSDQAFYLNSATINNSYSIPSGQNAGTFGPVSVASGAVVTVPSGSTWTIV